ncbi:hypothetical protein NBRC10512_003937 [Rhodotorula toruloides]|uniref:RHTO0S07e04896g1_1 n=2 Tax=Rhodotorula toruloides TaxID=5286 RepID=A0A061B7I6_RHOTO|nr:catabolite degradation protein [Rhodotorula toruloides NP11]EMS25142.1 catabolite degradation protein [Rhodotorula toruloides NP11]CDR42863.1 RHTO0S07e04896g1_1 [Rhodotorula toruloides]
MVQSTNPSQPVASTSNGHAPLVSDGSSPFASNGHSNGLASTSSPSPAMNGGKSVSNGTGGLDAMQYEGEEGFVPLWEGSNLDRREFVRLALQAFQDMGYNGTAEALQAESGFALEDPSIQQFRQGVLDGNWDLVERLLSHLPIEPTVDLTPIKFAIRQQKFLEAMELKQTKKALSVLRNELSPLNFDPNKLHFLSSLIMCSTPDDLRQRAGWDGAAGTSRQQLLVHLQDCISPSVMLPQHRLATLLGQAQAYQQRHRAVPPAPSEPFSLLVDADPRDVGAFPTVPAHVLQEHTDEVWRLEWSHNGEYLASAGKDRTAIIWSARNGFALDKILRDHAEPISYLAWSPDDSILLTTAESIIKMWNTETGTCIATLARHEYTIGAVAWLPDGRGFVSGGMDSKIFFWDLAGNVTAQLGRSPSRILDLAVTPDGSKLICVGRADTTEPHLVPSRLPSRSQTPANANANANGNGQGQMSLGARHEKRISVFRLPIGGAEMGGESQLIYELVQPQELSSIAVTRDSRYAIVSHAPKEILYLKLEDGTILRRFEGHDQGDFVVRPCFGGSTENFILSGSRDGKVYVYHRDTGQLLHVLVGHGSKTVNAVGWNPTSKHGAMWASCGDDGNVVVWSMPAGEDGEAMRRKGPRLRPLDRSMAIA